MMQDTILDEKIIFMEKGYPILMERLLAFLIDAILLGGWIFLVALFCRLTGVEYHLLYPLLFLIPCYKWWAGWKKGGTIGKRIMDITIVNNKNYTPITWQNAFKRNLVFFPYFIALIILYNAQDTVPGGSLNVAKTNFLWIFTLKEYILKYVLFYIFGIFFLFFSASNRTLFDYLSGTICIDKNVLSALETTD